MTIANTASDWHNTNTISCPVDRHPLFFRVSPRRCPYISTPSSTRRALHPVPRRISPRTLFAWLQTSSPTSIPRGPPARLPRLSPPRADVTALRLVTLTYSRSTAKTCVAPIPHRTVGVLDNAGMTRPTLAGRTSTKPSRSSYGLPAGYPCGQEISTSTPRTDPVALVEAGYLHSSFMSPALG